MATTNIANLYASVKTKADFKTNWKETSKADWKADWTPPAPVSAFVANVTTGVHPLTVNFTNNSTGSYTTSAWNFGDGTTGNTASPSHVFANAGTYTITLTVTGAGGSNTGTRAAYIVVT